MRTYFEKLRMRNKNGFEAPMKYKGDENSCETRGSKLSHEVQKLCSEAFPRERCLHSRLYDEHAKLHKTNSHKKNLQEINFLPKNSLQRNNEIAKFLQLRWNQILINWILFSQFHFHYYVFISGEILIRFKFNYEEVFIVFAFWKYELKWERESTF